MKMAQSYFNRYKFCYLLEFETNEAMSDGALDPDVKMRRELLASAAEKRLSPNAEESLEVTSSYENQGTSSSFEVPLSHSLFRYEKTFHLI